MMTISKVEGYALVIALILVASIARICEAAPGFTPQGVNSANSSGPAIFSIFDVRHTLPLNDHQKTYKDYYINAGTDNGVKAGDYLAVFRTVPVLDIERSKVQGEIVVPIAHMKIIQSEKTISVGRLAAISDPKNTPIVQYEGVMIGDRVAMSHEPAPAMAPAKTSEKGTAITAHAWAGAQAHHSAASNSKKASAKAKSVAKQVTKPKPRQTASLLATSKEPLTQAPNQEGAAAPKAEQAPSAQSAAMP